MSQSLLIVFAVLVASVLALVNHLLAHHPVASDGRTRLHRRLQKAVPSLIMVSTLVALGMALRAHKADVRLKAELADAKSREVEGILLPSNQQRPEGAACEIPDSVMAVFLGRTVVGYGPQNKFQVMTVGSTSVIGLERDRNGVYLNAVVMREDGRMSAVIRRNRFVINPNNYFRIASRDRSELIVVNEANEIVIHARFLNETTFWLTGKFSVSPTMTVSIQSDGVHYGKGNFLGWSCAEVMPWSSILGF